MAVCDAVFLNNAMSLSSFTCHFLCLNNGGMNFPSKPFAKRNAWLIAPAMAHAAAMASGTGKEIQ